MIAAEAAALAACAVLGCVAPFSVKDPGVQEMAAIYTEQSFDMEEISDETMERIRGKSFKEDCTTPVSDLRHLHLLHMGFDGKPHTGELICNTAIADDLLEIFRDLFDAGYQIEKIRLVDEYDADDETSMADNNTSSFNFRFIKFTTKVSKHGLGMAIDINPLYNPCIKTIDGELSIEPANAGPYVDRSADFPHKIGEGDLCLRLFREHGFTWGGDWIHTKDYQHFEK